MKSQPGKSQPGKWVMHLCLLGTVGFAVISVSAVIFPDALELINVIYSLVLFAIGCVAFVWAFFVAAGRSRLETLSVAGIYFLAGSAPNQVGWYFRILLFVMLCLAFTTAGIRPFTSQAFGVLAPMLILGLMGLWGAKWGSFPANNLQRSRQMAGQDGISKVSGSRNS